MVVTLLVVQVLSPFWKETEVFTYTFDLLVGGAVGIMVVFRVAERHSLCLRDRSFFGGCATVPGISWNPQHLLLADGTGDPACVHGHSSVS